MLTYSDDEQVKDEDLELLVKHFDVDRSGTIDREEFRKMVQTLCCGGKDIMTALKQVTNLHTSKLVVKKKPPVVHEVTAVNPDEMTASQLANQLTMLKMRLSNRNASDKAKKEIEDAEKAAAEELRLAGEKVRSLLALLVQKYRY
jgi:outer membrane protein assembly factor BamA